ncbi:hypothetical protein BJ875DRAFT_216281 [Amylocarpus encephaloides]|uniref:Nuclear RNA binding protein n=1 Tax=Amylocarpus encephaloides TaxID=45428 RepID=A0A9P7Y9J0_9HELO|nr:hypothetical protein BJ875DRAFT_216281 [Amylocarpus encephaloides]
MAGRFTENPRNPGRRSMDPQATVDHLDALAKAGTKRLFSNRDSKRLSHNPQTRDTNYGRPTPDDETHSPKRCRTSDWPLSNANPSPPVSDPPRRPLRSRNAPNSPNLQRSSSGAARPSRFLEGSMNDRVSQMPPVPYLGMEEEEACERASSRDTTGRRIATPRRMMNAPMETDGDSSFAGQSETSRHSSIFRFGKTIASTFNPSNWKIWNKPQPVVYDEESEQQQILKQRQEKAERIYRELKQSGHFPLTNATLSTYQEEADEKGQHSKHDSGVSFIDQAVPGSEPRGRPLRRSVEVPVEKRAGRVFLEAPSLRGQSRGPSPAISHRSGSAAPSKNASPNKPSIKLKRASFQNIKNALTSGSTTSLVANNYHSAKRIPSQKDLRKQQKLVKRVSDLEGKLQAARRQLTEALDEPVPNVPSRMGGRPRFVPGALPSLPSERLMAGYVAPEDDEDVEDVEMQMDIGRAVTLDEAAGDLPGLTAWGANYGLHAPGSRQTSQTRSIKPPATRHRVMQSVEADVSGDDEEINERPTPKAKPKMADPRVKKEPGLSTNSEEPSSELSSPPHSSDFEEEEEEEDASDREGTPRPARKKPSPLEKVPTSKSSPKTEAQRRRKISAFDRLVKDDGAYKPRHDTTTDDSEIRMPALKKRTPARPRKLQKVTRESELSSPPRAEESNSPVKTPTRAPPPVPRATLNGRANFTARNTVEHIAAQLTTTSTSSEAPPRTSSGRLTKKPHFTSPQRRSVSPPSRELGGIDYKKPSVSSPIQAVEQLEPRAAAYIANPALGHDVPPMPKMPKAVRLASGEVVYPPAPKPVEDEVEDEEEPKMGLTRDPESFVWDRDTF